MSVAQWLLLMLCLQLALYGVGWACTAVYLPRQRRVVVELLGFSLANALALGLLAVRAHVPDWLGRMGVDLLFLLGFVLMWRGCQRFMFGRTSAEAVWVGALGSLAIAWFSLVQVNPDARVLSLLLALSWVAVRSPWLGRRKIRREFGARTAWGLGLTGCAVAVALMAHAVTAYASGRPLEWAQDNNMHPALPFFFMVAAAMANLGLAFQVFTRMVRQLDHLSRHDALTGLFNRHAFMAALDVAWARFQRKAQPFAVLALDVDHFKRVNDSHGHAVGDEVLADLGALLRAHARQSDPVGRTGGEEFVLLLSVPPHGQGVAGHLGSADAAAQAVAQAAERLREAVAAHTWPGELALSVSIGVALARAEDADAAAVLRRADQALYAAKAQGRNRVVLAGGATRRSARRGREVAAPAEA